jgi:outer membrane receptor protein involved in Fe transport
MKLQPSLLALAAASFLASFATPSALAQTGDSVAAAIAGQAAPAAAAPANETAEQRAQRLAREQQAAQRQSAPPAERIVVTGARRAQAASSVPFNISAINGEQLRQDNITDLKALIQELPAVNAPGNSARFADSVTVRGLSIAPVNANNIEQFVRSTIAYYVDETPLPSVGLRIKDMARVETLLGPQGTLYGAGSLGGTIRYITNQPVLRQREGRLGLSLYQTAGGGLSYDADGMVNVPLGGGFAFRASLARLDEAGYTDRVSTPPWRSTPWTTSPNRNQNVYKDDDWQKVDTARGALLWQITPGFKLTLTHTQQDQLAHGTRGTSLQPLAVANARNPAELDAAWRNPGLELGQLPCNPNCRFTDARETPIAVDKNTVLARHEEFADREFRMTSLDVDLNLGFADLRSSTSTFKDARIGQADYASQGWVFYYSLGDLGGDIRSDRSAYITFDNTYKGLSHETRLISRGDGPASWIAGLYHTKQERNLRFNEVLPGMDAFLGNSKATPSPKPDVGYGEDLGSEYSETALFGEFSYKLTPQFQLTAGGRLFKYEDTARIEIVDYAGGFVDNRVTDTRGQSGKSIFKVNASYQLRPGLLSYLTVSQGFRRGGTNGFRNVGARVIADDAREYQPDTTTNYELGIKGHLFGGDLYVEAAAYMIDWKDAQTYRSQDIDGFPVNGTANGPDARSEGLEFALRWRFAPAWQMTFSTGTVESRWTSTKTHCLYTNRTSCRTWNAGGLMGGSPDWKHRLGLRYSTDIGSDMFLRVGGTVRYVGKTRSDRSDSIAGNDGVFVYPAYTTASLYAGIGKGKWDAQLWINNATNERGLVSNQTAGAVLGERLIYTVPRTVGLNLSYAF